MSKLDNLFGKLKKKVYKVEPKKSPKAKALKKQTTKKKELTEDEKENISLDKEISKTKDKLSDRKLRFIHFHLLGHSGKDSAIKALYSKKSASK